MSNSLRPHEPTRLLSPWDFPGKNTGVGCHFLLRGIFSTQGSSSGLSHCRQTLYHLCYQGSPRAKDYTGSNNGKCSQATLTLRSYQNVNKTTQQETKSTAKNWGCGVASERQPSPSSASSFSFTYGHPKSQGCFWIAQCPGPSIPIQLGTQPVRLPHFSHHEIFYVIIYFSTAWLLKIVIQQFIKWIYFHLKHW